MRLPLAGEFRPATEQQELIVRSYLEGGLTAPEIAKKLQLPNSTVNHVIRSARLRRKADHIREDVKSEIFSDKVPVLAAIGDMTLVGLFEWVQSFVQTGKHKKMDTSQAKDLTHIIEKLHTMFRLEVGKSTQNLSVMITESERSIQTIIADLKKPPSEGGDPFVEYPDGK
jgi:hypothetical protein